MKTKFSKNDRGIIKTATGNFQRALETLEHIYFVNFEEGDENGNVKMFTRKMELVSDNYFAHVGMVDDIESEVYSWASPKMKEFIKIIQKDLEDSK